MKFRIVTHRNIYRFICVLIIVIVASIRIHLADIPFERDEGEYAYAGQMILKGSPPYQDVYNMKFPGVYYMYALSFKMFGEGIQAPRYLVLVLQLIGAFFLYLLARRMIHYASGWLSAAAFMLFSLSLMFQGPMANAEQFLLAFLIPSLYFLYRGLEKHSLPNLATAGVLIALAATMKQHAFIFLGASLVWIVYTQRAGAVRYIGVYLAGVMVPLLLLFCYLWMAGVWSHFYFLTFQYARAYVGISSAPHVASDNLLTIYHKTEVLIWCTLISLVGLLLPGNIKVRLFITLFFLSSVAAVMMGFYFRPHYFMLLLPVFSLMFTYSAFRLTGSLITFFRLSILSIYIGITALLFLYTQRDCFFLLPPESVTEWIYPGTPFAISGEVASYIKSQSVPNDRICMLGAEPQLFFLSQRQASSGYIYTYPLLEKQKYADMMTDEFISQTEQCKPAILVYSSHTVFDEGANRDNRLYRWFSNYKNQYQLVAVSAPKSETDIRFTQFDTLAPMDTLSKMIPQIRVYKRIEIR